MYQLKKIFINLLAKSDNNIYMRLVLFVKIMNIMSEYQNNDDNESNFSV